MKTLRMAENQGFRALSPGDFSFFGFDGLMREIEGDIRHVEICGGEPGVSIVEDAVFVPSKQAGRARVRRGEIATSVRESSPDAAEREVDEDVVYLGWLFNHFGHFLMQSLARTWFLSEVSPSVRVVFHAPTRAKWQPANWMLRILEAFGVPSARILVLDAPTRLRRLIIPEPLFEPRSVAHDHVVRAHEAMARPYRAVAQRIAGDATPSEQPVYLSRRLLPPSNRTMVGEGELEEVLRENGFRIAHTQTMTFEDQVRLVNEHAHIFSNAGSAAHNVLFALHEPRLHLLTHGSQFSPDYYLYSRISRTPTSFINCLSTGQRPRFKGEHKRTPHLLDSRKLVAYLDQHGFLTRPMPVWPVGYDAELRARYDETWLYGYARAVNQRDALPPEVEEEALSLASSSWPVSLALAWYYAERNVARADSLARQCAELAATETDRHRLVSYRKEVTEMAPSLARCCDPETVRKLADLVTDPGRPASADARRLS